MRKPALLLAIALLSTSAGAQQPRVSLNAGDSGKISFASAGSIAKGGEAERYVVSDESITLSGELQFPAGRGPFPVVILAHTCAGLGYGEVTWAPRLREWGYATFIVDSFGPRGIAGVCNDPQRLFPFQRVPDVYGALRILATHPDIDANNAFLMGYSHGAILAMNAATRWAKDIYASGTRPAFRAFFAFYPYCNSRYPEREEISAPMRMHVGEVDDWTPAGPCRELTERLRAKGYDAQITAYPGAHHAFDMSFGFAMRMPGFTNAANCRPQYPSILGPIDYEKNFSGCITKGVTAGRNAEAIEQAAQVLRTQLSELRK
jgi:dienelactone hydrolase